MRRGAFRRAARQNEHFSNAGRPGSREMRACPALRVTQPAVHFSSNVRGSPARGVLKVLSYGQIEGLLIVLGGPRNTTAVGPCDLVAGAHGELAPAG